MAKIQLNNLENSACIRGINSVDAVGAIAPIVFLENPVDAENLHPQVKLRVNKNRCTHSRKFLTTHLHNNIKLEKYFYQQQFQFCSHFESFIWQVCAIFCQFSTIYVTYFVQYQISFNLAF